MRDLPARITELKAAGLCFRNEMEAGPGGKQVQIEDPDGNPIELFEPARTTRGELEVRTYGKATLPEGADDE